MSDDKAQFMEFIENHNLMTMATIKSKGEPDARSLEYINIEEKIYSFTSRKSRKITQLKNNPKVVCTISDNFENWQNIKGIRVSGEVCIVNSKAEIEMVMDKVIKKFPHLTKFPDKMRSEMVIIKVSPYSMRFIDSSEGWGSDKIIDFNMR